MLVLVNGDKQTFLNFFGEVGEFKQSGFISLNDRELARLFF